MRKLVFFLAILAISFVCAQTPSETKSAKPSVSITSMPTDTPSEIPARKPITGTAKDYPKGAKIMIFAKGDMWYVQPYTVSPFTDINSKGKWSTETHGGYKFAAFLVSKDYPIPDSPRAELPKVDGKKILAIVYGTPKR